MRRCAVTMGVFVFFSCGAWATPTQSMEAGLIVARTEKGLWARFSKPVQSGGIAPIRAFQDGEDIGVARVAWASTIPPYEALLTDIHPIPPMHPISRRTPYQSLFDEPAIATLQTGPTIVPGQYAFASPARESAAGDPLPITWQELLRRPEVHAYLRERGLSHASERLPDARMEPSLQMLTEDRHYLWQDPITMRLIARARRMLQERGMQRSKAPAHWFPLYVTKKPAEGETTL
jgi:hypothetical protein